MSFNCNKGWLFWKLLSNTNRQKYITDMLSENGCKNALVDELLKDLQYNVFDNDNLLYRLDKIFKHADVHSLWWRNDSSITSILLSNKIIEKSACSESRFIVTERITEFMSIPQFTKFFDECRDIKKREQLQRLDFRQMFVDRYRVTTRNVNVDEQFIYNLFDYYLERLIAVGYVMNIYDKVFRCNIIEYSVGAYYKDEEYARSYCALSTRECSLVIEQVITSLIDEPITVREMVRRFEIDYRCITDFIQKYFPEFSIRCTWIDGTLEYYISMDHCNIDFGQLTKHELVVLGSIRKKRRHLYDILGIVDTSITNTVSALISLGRRGSIDINEDGFVDRDAKHLYAQEEPVE